MTGRLALLLGLATAGLIALDVPASVLGPDVWRWPRRAFPDPLPLLAIVGIFLLLFLAAAGIRRRWGGHPNRARLPFLAAAVALVFGQMVLVTAIEPGGLSNVARRMMETSIAGDRAVVRTATAWASEPGRAERILGLGERLGGVPTGPPGTTDQTRAGAFAAGWLLMAFGALSVVPLLVILGGRSDPAAVAAAVLLAGCLPGFLLFTPRTDALSLFLVSAAAAFLVEGMRFASHAWAPVLALGAGMAASAGVLLSLAVGPALLAWGVAFTGMVTLAMRRGVPMPTTRKVVALAVFGVVGLVAVPGVVASRGGGWAALLREGAGAASGEPAAWATWGLADLLLFLGPPLVLAWIARIPAEIGTLRARTSTVIEIPFATAALVAAVFLTIRGADGGNTGRAWAALMPLALAAAAGSYASRAAAAVLPLALGQLAVLLAIRAFLDVPG